MELDETTTNSIIAIITAIGSVVAAITILMRELRRGHPVEPEIEEVDEEAEIVERIEAEIEGEPPPTETI